MKLTLKNIKELKINATPLEKRVLNYIVDEWRNYDDKKNIFTDVLNYLLLQSKNVLLQKLKSLNR